jgi:hypothetical protein
VPAGTASSCCDDPAVRPRRVSILLAAAASLSPVGLTACSHAGAGPPLGVSAAALPPSRSSHVIVLVMENQEASDVLGSSSAPYTNALARRYGLATQSYAIAHPSLPNYLALTSGSTDAITSDCTECHVASRNIVDQLQSAGISWRAYLEGMPAGCFHGATSGAYAKKHNPFLYYDDIMRSASRCSHLVGFGQLASDLRDGHLPTYAWISPNLCDDGHDCGLVSGDRFLARTVPLLIHELGPQGFLILTWDEGTTTLGCCGGGAAGGRIVTIVAGPSVRHGARQTAPVDHYGVLGTIEGALGLPPLAGAARPASGRLTSLFSSPPRIR